MAESGLVNETPFEAQEIFLSDEDGRTLITVVVKATYAIRPDGSLLLADEQVPVNVSGTYYGDPEVSSMRFEPEVAPMKLATDVVLVGHAYPDSPYAKHVDVGFQVGDIRKVIRVFGDRQWYTKMGFCRMSEPIPFDRIELQWERAFGGWDRTSENADKHRVELRNPVGVGFRSGLLAELVDGSPLPNMEDPRNLIGDFKDKPTPAGFGFIGPNWEPRVRFTGTYDRKWETTRLPLLPTDFDRRFHNAAPPGQIVNGYLRGDEPVVVAHAAPGPWLQFSLPNEPPPRIKLTVENEEDRHPEANLDTLILDTDAMHVLLLWRAYSVIRDAPHTVSAIRVVPGETSVHARPQRTSLAIA